MINLKLGLIGAGTLGRALAWAQTAQGYPVVAVASRSLSSAQALARTIPGCQAMPQAQQVADRCDLVFVTTPDEAIGPVVSKVRWAPGRGVIHCSGAQSLDALKYAAEMGASCASFHPLQTFAAVTAPAQATVRFEGVTFAIEAEGWLLAELQEMAARLGGKALLLKPENRALYHAAAVMSCGYLVTLMKAATDIWREMGFTEEEALQALMPLARTTLENVFEVGMRRAVTGPMVRGDTATLGQHLAALEERLPRLLPLYEALTLESRSLAGNKVDARKVEEMIALAESYLGRHESREKKHASDRERATDA